MAAKKLNLDEFNRFTNQLADKYFGVFEGRGEWPPDEPETKVKVSPSPDPNKLSFNRSAKPGEMFYAADQDKAWIGGADGNWLEYALDVRPVYNVDPRRVVEDLDKIDQILKEANETPKAPELPRPKCGRLMILDDED